MKTTMQTFCQAFSEELEPFGEQLGDALAELPPREDLKAADSTLLGLQEVQQRLSTLREKVSNQRTFLLIFGPLKSGKSTLMNALSGAYVSEVSSLPAYPALVYVRNGEQQRFVATDYEGASREFSDNLALAEAVQTDHARLADAIVEAEKAGEDFDPQKHHPRAIRRMDIEIPAEHLAESGSVLVDTPGLYSHMKFGYDQMTRDFRDTAACAIFVVKTDNLFFEKVFEEFEELLGCFSRIFLVANIDSSKRDLRPDGTLEPSVESRDPRKIIDSFRSLSMSATLRGAIEDGRLGIYPVDLQEAASQTLRAASGAAPDSAGDDPDSETGRDGGFGTFVDDLTGYLNSSDYLHDFMYDSVRLARDLTGEAGELVSGEAAEALQRGNQRAREELERERARRSALQKLEEQDWNEAFNGLGSEKERLLAESAAEGATRLEETCHEQLAAWMDSDESWNDLLHQRLNPQFQQESSRQADVLLDGLRARLEGGQAGASFSSMQEDAFRDAGLQVAEALSGCRRGFGAETQAETPELVVETSEISVTRGLGDYLLFRRRNRVRDEIFGDDGNRAIPAAVKQKRLGEDSLEQLRTIVRDTINNSMPELLRRYADDVVDAHVRTCSEALRRSISQLKEEREQHIIPLESELKLGEQAHAVFDRIQSNSDRFAGELMRLQHQFELE